jgi:hypothetical protein
MEIFLGVKNRLFTTQKNNSATVLPKISTSPYHATLEDNFILKPATSTKLDRLNFYFSHI